MITSLASLVNDVYALTNRPDLVGETSLAVRNATLKAHNLDFFDKDLLETGISFDYANTLQSLEYRSLIPRWRALKYLRKYYLVSGTDGTPGEMLTVLTPDSLLDSYSKNKENVCYLAGQEIKIRSSTACTHYLLGCYIHPNVTADEYSSWIADEQPAAIIYEAAAIVFKTIGYDEQVATYRNMVLQEYQQLQMSNVQTVGY